MYHPARKKLPNLLLKTLLSLLLVTLDLDYLQAKSVDISVKGTSKNPVEDSIDHNVIDFDEDYSIKFNKKYDTQWHGNSFNKDSYRYTVIKDNEDYKTNRSIFNDSQIKNEPNIQNATVKTTTQDYSVIPLELISTTENKLIIILESTTEYDLSVIPLSTTDTIPKIEINDTFTLPSSTSTENYETTTYYSTTEQKEGRDDFKLTVIPLANVNNATEMNETTIKSIYQSTTESIITENIDIVTTFTEKLSKTTFVETTMKIEIMNVTKTPITLKLNSNMNDNKNTSVNINHSTTFNVNDTKYDITNTTVNKNISRADTTSTESEEEVPIFTELDAEDVKDVPEDYYDSKDVVPTTAPRTDALSVIFGLAGTVVESVVESVAERVVPKSIFDLFKRMQRQNEALEAERLRSREENGGLGQFTRGIIKSISTGISKPLSQLVAGARDIGSLDTDRGFVASIASGVTSVANVAYSVADAFKDRVQAIYPGTVWCGDGRSATARSSDLGLFFFTDTCCRQHDACKLYIKSGETKYGLTNTGLFTRSHCSCDVKFRECLHRTNSLVSSQIGLTYFNVLGPQCFRRAHPIVRCVRRTRITGLKCEEYELDYTKPRMWQWFDNETF